MREMPSVMLLNNTTLATIKTATFEESGLWLRIVLKTLSNSQFLHFGGSYLSMPCIC